MRSVGSRAWGATRALLVPASCAAALLSCVAASGDASRDVDDRDRTGGAAADPATAPASPSCSPSGDARGSRGSSTSAPVPRDAGAEASDDADASRTDDAEDEEDAEDAGSDAGQTALSADGGATGSCEDASAAPAFDCEALVEVDQIRPTSCAVVDPVSHRVGLLRWVCAGGPAELTLGDLELAGSVQGDVVELSACREDPVSWLSGHYERVSVSARLDAGRGSLSFERATGLSCTRTYTDCNATAAVSLIRD